MCNGLFDLIVLKANDARFCQKIQIAIFCWKSNFGKMKSQFFSQFFNVGISIIKSLKWTIYQCQIRPNTNRNKAEDKTWLISVNNWGNRLRERTWTELLLSPKPVIVSRFFLAKVTNVHDSAVACDDVWAGVEFNIGVDVVSWAEREWRRKLTRHLPPVLEPLEEESAGS